MVRERGRRVTLGLGISLFYSSGQPSATVDLRDWSISYYRRTPLQYSTYQLIKIKHAKNSSVPNILLQISLWSGLDICAPFAIFRAESFDKNLEGKNVSTPTLN